MLGPFNFNRGSAGVARDNVSRFGQRQARTDHVRRDLRRKSQTQGAEAECDHAVYVNAIRKDRIEAQIEHWAKRIGLAVDARRNYAMRS